jgi:hypothetical protein
MTAASELKDRLPDLRDLADIDLPRMEQVGRDAGRSADQTIDRLLGKSRNPSWPWLATALGLAVVIGAIAAYMAWMRRPPVDTSAVDTPADESGWTRESAPDAGWQAEPTPVSELGTSPLDA